MTKKELFRALDDGSPVEVVDVVSRCVYHGRITGVHIRMGTNGTRTYTPEVTDPCGHAVMCPRLENVRLV